MLRPLPLLLILASLALALSLATAFAAHSAPGQITYVSYYIENPQSPIIFTTKPDVTDSNPLVLYEGEDYWSSPISFSCSPDGRHIAYVSVLGKMHLLNLVTGMTIPLDKGMYPRWSPDGYRLAYVGDSDERANIYVMDIARILRGEAKSESSLILRNNEEAEVNSLTWSPDGNKIAFSLMRNPSEASDAPDIYVINADGSSITNLTNSPDFAEREPAWSPDGRHIAFSGGPPIGYLSEIYVMNADGSNRVNLNFTGRGVFDTDPEWSLDGKQIVFTTDRDYHDVTYPVLDIAPGMPQVYIMNADGTNPRRITHNLISHDTPQWCRTLEASNLMDTSIITALFASALLLVLLIAHLAQKHTRNNASRLAG